MKMAPTYRATAFTVAKGWTKINKPKKMEIRERSAENSQ